MKNSKFFAAIACSLSLVAAGGAILASSPDKAQSSANAATATTIYYAMKDADRPSNFDHVKFNAKLQGDHDNWIGKDMTVCNEFTFNNFTIYKVEFTDLYDGLATIQFQCMTSSGGWISQWIPFENSWTSVSTYNNRMFIHNGSNKAYETTFKTAYLKVWDSWNTPYIHVWESIGSGDKNAFGNWPGLKLNTPDPNMKFNGGKLYKVDIPYQNPNNVKFIYNDNSNQSDTFSSIPDKAYYWHNGSAWVADQDLAPAAEFVYDFNEARMNVKASDGIQSYSICGLNYSEWTSRYEALMTSQSENALEVMNNSTINTYTSSEDATHKDFKISEMMDYLVSLSANSKGARNFAPSINSGESTLLITISSIAALIGIGFFLFSKKKTVQY